MPKIIIKEIEPTKVFALVGHTLVSGKSGSGKSNACEWLVTNVFENGGTKIIDLYDSGRFENMLYEFPETKAYLVQKLFNLTGQQPRGFPNQIIIVPGHDLKFCQKLPKNMKLMSFNIEDLNIDDLYYLLGASEKLQGFLASISNEFGDEVNIKDIYEILMFNRFRGEHARISCNAQTKAMIIRNIRRWMSSGIFSDKLPKINFKEILEDTERITSFSTFLLDTEEAERMAYGLILKKINDAKRRRLVPNRVLVYLREMSVFFQAEWGMSKKYILEYLRQGRDRGIDLVCDMQRMMDIHATFRRQFGMVILLKTDYNDAEKIWDFHSDIPKRVISKAPKWGVGEGIFVSGTDWVYPNLYPPARHLHKHPGLNVLDLMGEIHGYEKYKQNKIEEIMRFEIEKPEVKEVVEVEETNPMYRP